MKQNLFKKTVVLMLVLCMISANLLTGCGKAGGGSGDDLVITVGPQPETIDPALNTTLDGGTLINHAFEGLMKLDKDGAVINGMVSKVDVDDTNTIYTFTLRDDAKWSDGQALVAEDFVYSWQRLVDPTTASEYNYMIDMVLNANEIMAGDVDKAELGIVAVDEKTIKVTLANPSSYFLEVCAFPATYPVRKDIVEANPDGWTRTASTYIGNGPYKVENWTDLEKIVMVKNENYYDYKKLGPNSITFELIEDSNTILSAFKNGEILFGDDLPSENIEEMTGKGLYIIPQLGTYYISLNVDIEVLQDVRVRKALALAIDRQYIVDQVAKGGQLPATSFVPMGLSDNNIKDEFQKNATPWYDISDYRKNVEEAKELLAQAGYPNGEGFPTLEYMYNTNALHQSMGEALQYMWKEELGINVTLSSQDWAVFVPTRTNGDYQIARDGWISDYNDPISMLDIFLTDGGNNNPNYSNTEYDEIIRKVKASSDRGERYTLMHEAEDLLGKDLPAIPIFYYTDLYLLSDKLEGFYTSPLGFKYFMYCTIK